MQEPNKHGSFARRWAAVDTLADVDTLPLDVQKKLVGAKLTRLMKDFKGGPLTLPALEKLTGGRLSKSRLGNYTQGTRLPDAGAAAILAAVFGTTAADILCLDEHLPAMSENEIQAIQDLRALPDNERQEFLRHLAAVAVLRREERLRRGLGPEPPAFPSPPKNQ